MADGDADRWRAYDIMGYELPALLDAIAAAHLAIDAAYDAHPRVNEEADVYLCRANPLAAKEAFRKAYQELGEAEEAVGLYAVKRVGKTSKRLESCARARKVMREENGK